MKKIKKILKNIIFKYIMFFLVDYRENTYHKVTRIMTTSPTLPVYTWSALYTQSAVRILYWPVIRSPTRSKCACEKNIKGSTRNWRITCNLQYICYNTLYSIFHFFLLAPDWRFVIGQIRFNIYFWFYSFVYFSSPCRNDQFAVL